MSAKGGQWQPTAATRFVQSRGRIEGSEPDPDLNDVFDIVRMALRPVPVAGTHHDQVEGSHPLRLRYPLVRFSRQPHRTSGQAALYFGGATKHGSRDRTIITGSLGTLESTGPELGQQRGTLTTAAGFSRPQLTRTWFNDRFIGAMSALLSAVETGRPPLHNARDNLAGLGRAFAAIASARRGIPVVPGSVRSMEEAVS